MPLREQDRAVWIGGAASSGPHWWIPTYGSSGKVRGISEDGKMALVSWGDGHDRWCRIGRTRPEVVTCKQAANRGIEPWASAFSAKPRPRRERGPYEPVSVFSLPPEVQAHIDRWEEYERGHS